MIKNWQIFKQADKDSAAAEAGENLNRLLIENQKRPVLLMLAGGSALALLDYVGKTAMGPDLTVSMLDERFSVDESINNFSQMQKTDFYTDALEAEASFFGSLPRSEDTKESLAIRWERNLKTWREENPGGLIIATLGMGPDGHTAGIFPYPEDSSLFHRMFKSDAWVTAYNAEGKHKFPERVTTTLTFFKLIDFGIAFVCGPEKKEKFEKVLTASGNAASLPALAWHEIKDVKVFTDIG